MRVKKSILYKCVAVTCCVLLALCFFSQTGAFRLRASAAAGDGDRTAVQADSIAAAREERFFGKWSGGAWRQEPKMNYASSGLEEVEFYAKSGDYENAKKALFAYYKRRDNVHAVSPESLTGMAADLMLQNIIAWNYDEYLSYISVGAQEDWYKFGVLSGITLGQVNGFELIARGKRDNVTVFGSRESAFAPYLELTINGVKTVVYPAKDATIRAGEYRTAQYGSQSTLEVNDTGYPTDSNSRRSLLVFDLSAYSGLVSAANLYLHGAASGDNVEIMAFKHLDNAWNENEISFSRANLRVFSWEGDMSKWDWGAPDGCAEQFDRSILTLNFLYHLTRAYQATRRALYAQKAIEMLVCVARHAGDNPRFGDVLRLGNRGETMTNCFGYLVKTPYMTAQECFEIVYYMWVQGECLGDPKLEYPRYNPDRGVASYSSDGNWGVTQTTGLYYLSHFFYEFVKAPQWQALAVSRIPALLDDVIYVDGSYMEDCTSYVSVTLGSALNIVKMAKLNGFSLNESTERRILKMLEYVMTFSMPNGIDPNYGDSASSSTIGTIRQFVDLYSEEGPLLYYVSRGSMGIEPTYTSRLYPNVRWGILRSGWDEDSLYMHINTQSGTHNHWDSNAVILYAYGRNLLPDTGRKSYDNADPDADWQRKNVESHNTLQVNDDKGLASGFVNEVRAYDTTDAATWYQGYNEQASKTTGHTRTVLMISDGFYIVSDYAVDSGNPVYHLNWHLPVSSNPVTDTANNKTYTTFSTGANLQIVSSVAPAAITERQGVLTQDVIGQAIPYPYMKYSYAADYKLNVSTLLYPTREGDTQDVTMQPVALSDANSDAQAVRINFDGTRGNHTAYYYLSNENTPSRRGYGDFFTDGQLAYTEYDASGKPIRLVYHGGAYLTNGDSELLSSPQKLAFITATYGGETLALEGNLIPSTDRADAVKIYAPDITVVTVNGAAVAFEREGDYIYAAKSAHEYDRAALSAQAEALPSFADITIEDRDAVALVRTAALMYEAKGYELPYDVSARLNELEDGLNFLAQISEVERDIRVLMPNGLTLDTVTVANTIRLQLEKIASGYARAQEIHAYCSLKEKLNGYLREAEALQTLLSDKPIVKTYSLQESLRAMLAAENLDDAEPGSANGYNGFYFYTMSKTDGALPMRLHSEQNDKYCGQNSVGCYWKVDFIHPANTVWLMCGWRAQTDCIVRYDFQTYAASYFQNGYFANPNGANVYISKGTLDGGYPYTAAMQPSADLLYGAHLDNRDNILGNPVAYAGTLRLKAGEVIWVGLDPNGNTSYFQLLAEATVKVLSAAPASSDVSDEEAIESVERIQSRLLSLPSPESVTLSDGAWILQIEKDLALYEDPRDFYGYDDYIEVRNAYAALGASASGETHAVTVLPSEGGSVCASHDFVRAGAQVLLSVTPQPGYKLVKDSICINNVPIDSLNFIMPEGDAVVSARFERIRFGIAAAENEGVRVRLSVQSASAGDTVYYTFAVPYGYKVREGSVKLNGETLTDNHFVMPNGDALLTYEVEKTIGKASPVGWIVFGVACGAVLLAGGGVLMYLFVFKRRKAKKCTQD